VVRNHEDGTRLRRWNFEAEASDLRVERWSGRCNGKSMEGRQAHPMGTSVPMVCGRTGRMAVESAGKMGTAPEWSEGEEVRIERFFREPSGRTERGETPRMSLATGNIEGGSREVQPTCTANRTGVQ